MGQTELDQKCRGREIMGKEGEGTRQRPCMNDTRTWTTVWELTVVVGMAWAEEGKGRKIGIM